MENLKFIFFLSFFYSFKSIFTDIIGNKRRIMQEFIILCLRVLKSKNVLEDLNTFDLPTVLIECYI